MSLGCMDLGRGGAIDWCAARLVLAGLILLAGCAPPRQRQIEVWVGDDVYGGVTKLGQPVRQDAGAGPRVTLTGAINETVSLSLALSARGTGLPAVTVRPTALRGGGAVIPSNAVAIYRVHDVELRRLPGWHIRSVPPQDRVAQVADVLVPIDASDGGLPQDLPAGAVVTLWADVHIPKGTAPGTYSGSIDVLSGSSVLTAVDIRLTVRPFVLPDTTDVVVFAELDHQLLFGHHATVEGRPLGPIRNWGSHPAAGELDNLLTEGMRLLETHKVTPLLTGLMPVARVDADGDVEVDWDEYDRVVGPFLSGRRFFDRQPLPVWQLPFNAEFPSPSHYGAQLSPEYSTLARQYLARCAEHFAERGWLERSFVRLPHAEVGSAEAYTAVRHFGRVVRQADERLRTLAPLCPQDLAAYGWEGFVWEEAGRYVDIWSPPAQFFDRPEMQRQTQRGRRAFWSLDRPPFSGSLDLCAGPADTWVIGWQARAIGVEAVSLGVANPWPAVSGQAATPQMCCDAGPPPLVYPGRFCGLSGPIPSVRLKRLRRSMQDLAYLKLLADQGGAHIATVLTESLAARAASDAYGAHFADGRPGGWVTDPQLWSVARRILADEITRSMRRASRVRAAEVSDSNLLADTVQWGRFMERARPVEMKADGVRVRPTGPPSEGRLEVAVSVTVFNRTRVPLSGTLAFEELPSGWEPERPEVTVDEIAPQKSRRITLRAVANAVETDAGGATYVPVILRASSGQVHRLCARLTYLSAHTLSRPLTIDGDLWDWPNAVGHAAEDFVLLTGEAGRAARRPDTRATYDTQGFVARDAEALYFGFNCSMDDAFSLPATHQNYVRYEDGVPSDEELVEILIAPDNTATRSPAGFYHVVVKPYGSFWERGVALNPQVGARSDWAAGIRTAVQIHSDHWVAEVRIPLEAFETRNISGAVWGLNFSRFNRSTQESSNWSGAAHNVHDPLAAGNLALP